MSELEEKSALASARDAGMRRGTKIVEQLGLKKGKEVGAKENKEKIAKKLINLKIPIKQIIEITE